MAHQKAALALITTLYTPEKMNAHESLRKVLQWYARFDIFVGILSGSATQLDREWFSSHHECYKQKCEEFPDQIPWKYEERYAWIRLTGYDMRAFMRKRTQGELSDEEFENQLAGFDETIKNIDTSLDPMLMDESKKLADISEGRTRDPDDIVDPFEPNILYGDDLFDTNIVIHDLMGYKLLYINQVGVATGKHDPAMCREIALKQCQLYEAVTMYSGSPPGLRFGIQAGLALCLLFVRESEKEIWWARKQLAEIEEKG